MRIAVLIASLLAGVAGCAAPTPRPARPGERFGHLEPVWKPEVEEATLHRRVKKRRKRRSRPSGRRSRKRTSARRPAEGTSRPRKVSLELRQVPLYLALERIARAGGVRLYNRAAGDAPVTWRVRGLRWDHALHRLLHHHALAGERPTPDEVVVRRLRGRRGLDPPPHPDQLHCPTCRCGAGVVRGRAAR